MDRTVKVSQSGVLWRQVWGLAAVQAAITLAWVVYVAYLPQLLSQFGFPKAMAAGLLIVENALAVVMEPLMGSLSDKSQRWLGSRFGFISLGAVLSSALFMAIPVIAVFGLVGVTRWLLPIVLMAWALAMTVIRSPVVALLGRYAAPAQLPLAASLLTLAGGLIGAFKGVSHRFILSWGAAFTFAIASFLLLGATAVLRRIHPPETPIGSPPNSGRLELSALALILGTGAAVGWGSRFLLETLQKLLKTQVGADNIDWLMVGIAIALAIVALPAGALAVRIGNRRAILYGICATIALMLLMVYMGAQILTIILIIPAFSLIVNGGIPFALELMPQQAGLAVGMYLGGAAGAASLIGLAFPQISKIAPIESAIWSAIAFLVAAACIVASSIPAPQDLTNQ